MANDEMTTLSVAETDNDPQKNAQALERLLQSMFDASNQIVRDAGTRFETLIRDWFMNEPTYKDHFSEVQTWKDWANQHPNLTFNAKDTGIYRPSRHLEQVKFEGRVPGGDYEGYVDAHVRRLEALRRAGIVERIDTDQWRIPEDFESRAAYDAGRDRQASVRVLSPVNLDRQIGSDGATWLDRRLIHGEAADLAPTGFGQQVREAMDQRREHHIEQGDATRARDGRIFYRRNLLAILREREVARIGSEMGETKGLPFRTATDGENVSGKFTGTVQLSSGKFAVVEKSYEFTLVPWRPVIDRQLGREVAGVVQRGSVSWQLGRQRGISL